MTSLTPQSEASLPHHLATIFMEAAAQGRTLPLDLISLLTQMALSSDIDLAQEATASLYGNIILPLCDDFSSQGVDLANSVLITMIQTFCRTSKGKKTRQILDTFHLNDQEKFLSRHQELMHCRAPLSPARKHRVKKVFILSRITLGADIAITSLIVSRLQRALPHAAIFLVGPEHLRHLFFSNDLHYLNFSYDRDGGFLKKMEAWPRLFELIADMSKDLAPPDILLFDPDTRLSQLGLLPLTYTESSYYLCTRQDQDKKQSLPQITNRWLDHIFPETPACPPHFTIDPARMSRCQVFAGHLPVKAFKIVINFGVGNDNNKRLDDPFEEELLAVLLSKANTLIILDSGKGAHEEEMAKRLMAKITEKGYKTAEITEMQLADASISFAHGLLRFSGKIDFMAGLIECSDLFIGYDSCGQHIATSTETPSIICFTGAPNKRFLERWQPGNHHGKTTTFIIDHKPLSAQKRSALIGKIVNTADQYRS